MHHRFSHDHFSDIIIVSNLESREKQLPGYQDCESELTGVGFKHLLYDINNKLSYMKRNQNSYIWTFFIVDCHECDMWGVMCWGWSRGHTGSSSEQVNQNLALIRQMSVGHFAGIAEKCYWQKSLRMTPFIHPTQILTRWTARTWCSPTWSWRRLSRTFRTGSSQVT